MDFDTRTLSDLFLPVEISFEPSSWQFAFTRTLPVAIYVDAGEELSSAIGDIVRERLDRELQDLGFDPLESLTKDYGSILELNLSRTPKADTGPQTESKLRTLRTKLVKYFRTEFFDELKRAGKDTHALVKIAVGIGTIVVLLSTVPTAGVVVGTLVISAQAWNMLVLAKETGDIVEAGATLFTGSKEASEALRREPMESDPILYESALEKRLRDLEKTVQTQQEEMRVLQSKQDKP